MEVAASNSAELDGESRLWPTQNVPHGVTNHVAQVFYYCS